VRHETTKCDIWRMYAPPCAPAESAAMVRAVRPKAAGWCGQELSFGLWCRDQRRPPDEAAVTTARRSSSFVPMAATAVVVICPDGGDGCFAAGPGRFYGEP
jgi:hypothetical protein